MGVMHLKLVVYDDEHRVVSVFENVTSYKVEPISPDMRNIVINNGIHSLEATEWRCLEVDDSYVVSVGDTLDYNIILDLRKKEKIEELKAKCRETIYGGFTIPPETTYTNLIGNEYGFDQEDQDNFCQQMLFIAEISPDEPIYWKTKNKGPLPHTIDEFKEVCRWAEQHKRSNIHKCWDLQTQVQNATTIEEIESITW